MALLTYEPTEFAARAKQYFDEFRARQKKTINTLTGSSIPRAAAEQIFARPKNVRVETPDNEIAPARTELPKIDKMLREMGSPFPQAGWLAVAYSLLGQYTHSTSIGLLHSVRYRDGTWLGNEVSTEMLALTLDTACLGSAHILGLSAMVLTDVNEKAIKYRQELLQQAARVHSQARLVHGLDRSTIAS